jgi:hypothetical protein
MSETLTLRTGDVRVDTDGSLLIVGRHAAGLPHHRIVRYAATGARVGALLSDGFLASLPVWQSPADQVMAARIERARQECRIAQLAGEMVTEGWDRATATAIAREFTRAGA